MKPCLVLPIVLLCAAPVWAGEEPMLGSGDSFWGDLSLAYRLRLETRDNGDLDAALPDTTFMALQRVRLGLELHHADWIEVLAQLQD